MTQIRDMLFVLRLERQIGRPLTQHELNMDEFEVRFPDGRYQWIEIPRLFFPYDLIHVDYDPEKETIYLIREEFGFMVVEKEYPVEDDLNLNDGDETYLN